MSAGGLSKAFSKTLAVMLICEHVKKLDPTFNLNYASLIKDLPTLIPQAKDQLKNELTNELTNRLTFLNQFSAKP
jgi:hypothetical protein